MREGEQLISAALEQLRQLGTSGCSEQIVKYVPPIETGCGFADQRLWKPSLCSALIFTDLTGPYFAFWALLRLT